MLLGWTRFHDLPFLGEEAFFTCRGRMLHIRTETFLGNRGRSKDRRGCGRAFSVIGRIAYQPVTNASIEMDQEKPEDSYPNTFVPGRNMVFLTFAAILARGKGIYHLVTGVSEADYSGYPDCRDTFVRSLNVTLNLAMDEQFVIHTPLMDRDKSEVWELSDELGVFDLVRTQTLTCYNGVMAEGCGHCPACKLRKDGLEKYLKRKEENQK